MNLTIRAADNSAFIKQWLDEQERNGVSRQRRHPRPRRHRQPVCEVTY